MAEEFNIILEHLRVIRGTQDLHTRELARLGEQMRAANEHLAAFHRGLNTHDADVAELKLRIERIEKRLSLNDPEH